MLRLLIKGTQSETEMALKQRGLVACELKSYFNSFGRPESYAYIARPADSTFRMIHEWYGETPVVIGSTLSYPAGTLLFFQEL